MNFAGADPLRPALLAAERCVTFGQLGAAIASCGKALAHAGLRGRRVGLLVPPGIDGGALLVALASNAQLMPLNPGLRPGEIASAAQAFALDAVIAQATLAGEFRFETQAAGGRLSVPDDTGTMLLLRSSGTTGAPKLVPVTQANLAAMAEKLASPRWLGLSSRDRAAAVLPLYYAAGIKTSLFVPLMLGASVAFPEPGDAVKLDAWLHHLEPTYLSVAPALLRAMTERVQATGYEAGGLRFVMCAAAYLPDEVRVAAESALGVPVVEYYALSEAGVVACNPLRERRPGTVGIPMPGEMRITGEDGTEAARGSVGQVSVGGKGVSPPHVRDGWMPTGDLARMDEDGYVTLVARANEVINRGGEKVFPYEIEKALLAHPGVGEAAVFGVPHPRLGETVAAAVVLKTGSSANEHEIKDFLAARVARFKLPRRVRFMASLPRSESGKLLRRALRDGHALSRRPRVAPSGLLEVELHDLWTRMLGTPDIGVDDDFLEKGGDSLLATEMLLEVEALTGRPYPQSELATLTIRRIADVVSAGMSEERGVITRVRGGPGIPLFFCHGDYMTRGLYAHRLAGLLPARQPVYLLHSRADRSLGSSIEEIAQAYLPEVLRAAAGSPVFVGGFCNGGLAAWHLASLLRAQGTEVVEVLLIETLSLNARPELRMLPGLFRALGRMIPGKAGRFLREDAMRAVWIRKRGFETFSHLLYRMTRRKLQPAAAAQRDAAHVATQMHLQFMARYVPPAIDVPVTCFLVENGCRADMEPRYWRGLAAGVSEARVPGTHLSCIVSGRQALAAALGETLVRARPRYFTTPRRLALPHADALHQQFRGQR